MLLLKNIELPSTHISCRFECFDFGGLCQTHALGRCLDWRSVFLMGIWVFLLSFNYYYFFSWSIVELQCCISFCYIAKWVRFFPFFFFFLQPTSLLCPWKEHWSGLPFPPLGDLPNPGIEPASLSSPALAGSFFTTSASSMSLLLFWCIHYLLYFY